MSEVTVTLNDVESKDVIARGEEATVYTFNCSDGRGYTTFKRDVAIPGSKLRNRLVVLDYSEKAWQKGEKSGFNYYLNSIKLADAGVVRGAAIQVDALDNRPALITSQSDKDVSIARAVALKAAVETAVGLEMQAANQGDIIAIANVYAGWLLTGAANPEPVAAGDFPF